MRVLMPNEAPRRARTAVARVSLPGAVDDRLYFAQVREDPRAEIAAFDSGPDDSLVVVGFGGCTALSLVAAGAGQVTAVDVNRAQNHLIELKLAAISVLSREETLAFLGASDAPARDRLDTYLRLRPRLSAAARAYWDGQHPLVDRGILAAGVTERFIRMLVAALGLLAHPRARLERMLACESIEEQRALFAREWNTRRWRLFFALLLNRRVFRRTYDPAFFAHLEQPSFADHFRRCAEHALTELPVRGNYFLHHMISGRYPVDATDGVPPYLSDEGHAVVASAPERLTLVDGSMTDYLRILPDESVTGFSLSNICEWLAPNEVDALFAEIVRVAAPGATVCFRNFVGWTEVPARFQHLVREDRALGDELTKRDRSVVARRIAVCRVTSGELR
jgi:S-adenosylmethionine-diacylglycerol 3-amino-3-carboxypropyl transferase